jgi:hypothetical protein
MSALAVVEQFQVVEDCGPRFFATEEVPMMRQFVKER